MIYNNYPDDYIVINAKWVEWDNDNECWCFMTEDAFEKAQSLADYTKQVRKEVVQEIRNKLKENGLLYTWKGEPKYKTMEELLDQIQSNE